MAIVTFSKTTPAAPGGSDNVTFQTDGNPNPRISANVPEATTGIKGLVKLAGDLAGTSALPTVPGLTAKAPSASPTFTGTVTVPNPPVNATDAACKDYVDTAASAIIAAPSLSTAGQGYFFGPGVTRPVLASEGQSVSLVASANKVVVTQFTLMEKITIRNCSWSKGGGTNTKHHSFGIYNAAGALLIAAAFTNTATAALIETVSFTAVVLPPGVYYFAQTDEDAATSGVGSTSPATATWVTLFNAVAGHIAVAANSATAGALPATLGALTALTGAVGYGLAYPLWEP